MKSAISLLLVLGLFGSALSAQDGKYLGFAGLTTGRMWIEMDDFEKNMFLMTTRETIVAVAMQDNPLDVMAGYYKHWAKDFSLADYKYEIDLVYKDRANVNIPMAMIIRYVTIKLKGESTKQKLEERLLDLRKLTTQ